MNNITVKYLTDKGFKELGNSLGSAHYVKEEYSKDLGFLNIEIRHTQENNKFWLTDGKSCYTIRRELTKIDEVEKLITFNCFKK